MKMQNAVDIIEEMFGNHILLAGKVVNLSFLHKLFSKFCVCKLFCRRKKQCALTAGLFHLLLQRNQCTGADYLLCGMTACVGCCCFRIGKRMPCRGNRIQLRNDSDMRFSGTD